MVFPSHVMTFQHIDEIVSAYNSNKKKKHKTTTRTSMEMYNLM